MRFLNTVIPSFFVMFLLLFIFSPKAHATTYGDFYYSSSSCYITGWICDNTKPDFGTNEIIASFDVDTDYSYTTHTGKFMHITKANTIWGTWDPTGQGIHANSDLGGIIGTNAKPYCGSANSKAHWFKFKLPGNTVDGIANFNPSTSHTYFLHAIEAGTNNPKITEHTFTCSGTTTATTPKPSVTPSPSPTIATTGDITLHLEGIDSSNYQNDQNTIPTKESQGSAKTRTATLYFYPATAHPETDEPTYTATDTLTQITDSSNPLFGNFRQPNFKLPNVKNGTYIVLVKVQEGSLIEYLTGSQTPIQIYNQGGSNVLVDVDNVDLTAKNLTYVPPTIPPTLRMGDIVTKCTDAATCDFNTIGPFDYSALVDCYGSKITSDDCKAHNYNGTSDPNMLNGKQYFVADLNGDGVVDGIDYTMLLKNYKVSGVSVNLSGSKMKASVPIQPTPAQSSNSSTPTNTPTTGSTPTPTPTPTGSTTSSSQTQSQSSSPPSSNSQQTACLQAPVLALAYIPEDPNDSSVIDQTETGLTGTITTWKSNVTNLIQENMKYSTDFTRYHGYKDTTAKPSIQYTLVDQPHIFTSKIPHGPASSNPPGSYYPNYGQILNNINICNYVDTKNIKEVWLYGYHSNAIVPIESKMSSKYGDIANDSLLPESSEATQYRLPICQHSYVVYNFNYGREVATEIHDRIHQIENVIPFAEGPGKWPQPSYIADQTQSNIFWGNFAVTYPSGSTLTNNTATKTGCGNTHLAPNWKQFAGWGTYDDSKYDLTGNINSNCENWPNNQYQSVSSSTWKLDSNLTSEMNYYRWWMQNMPGLNNGIVMNGKHMRNWWEVMYDFNGFIDKGQTLFDKPAVTCTS